MTLVPPCTRGPGGTPCGRATRTPRIPPGECPRCWVNQYTRAELAAFRPPAGAAPATHPRGRCLHLGPQLSAFDRPKCQRLFACEKGHGGTAGVCPSKECRACGDYAADVPIETGNEAVQSPP